MKTKVMIAVGVVVLVLAAGGVWIWSLAGTNVLRLPGVVEVQEVRARARAGEFARDRCGTVARGCLRHDLECADGEDVETFPV